MKVKTVKYELSDDRKGLLKYFRTKEDGEESYWHVHSDEMIDLEVMVHLCLSARDREGWNEKDGAELASFSLHQYAAVGGRMDIEETAAVIRTFCGGNDETRDNEVTSLPND